MFRRIRTNSVSLVCAFLAQLLVVPAALAHHPEIEAEAGCRETGSTISYTSTSWSDAQFEGENPAIEISVNGFVVETGAYVYPANAFSGTTPSPAGSSATIRAYAAGDWGSGTSGGQSESTTVSLPEDCPSVTGEGRFTGGGHQLRVDNARITRGLTVHCDLLLSNNLQVNWPANKFHMTEHLETVMCTDDPFIIQGPPAAPLDTLIGVGTGRHNNVDGFTIEFTLVDQGEPGKGVDQMAIKIYETASPDNVVLDIPLQVMIGGNLQAHYDQPHK
jgi:hypothetical protein